MNTGNLSQTRYDRCAYQRHLYEEVSPLKYQMYGGKFENCSKCTYDKHSFWRPFDDAIIIAENELKNLTRPHSRCPQYKYNPNCRKSCLCTGTFDPSNPVVLSQEVCPIIFNNIKKMKNPGYTLQTEPFCSE